MRRAISRSRAIFEWAGVSESGTVSRFAQAGTVGPSYPRAEHPPVQDSTAPRRAFQVFTAGRRDGRRITAGPLLLLGLGAGRRRARLPHRRHGTGHKIWAVPAKGHL